MIAFIWNWFLSWVIGWGGVGALVTAAAWLLWWFTPSFLLQWKSLLLHAAVGLTVFTIASTYFFTKGYDDGVALTTAQWDAANEKAKRDAKARDDAIAAAAESKVKQATDELERQAAELQGKVNDYAKQLAASKGGACLLTDDDVRRLRGF